MVMNITSDSHICQRGTSSMSSTRRSSAYGTSSTRMVDSCVPSGTLRQPAARIAAEQLQLLERHAGGQCAEQNRHVDARAFVRAHRGADGSNTQSQIRDVRQQLQCAQGVHAGSFRNSPSQDRPGKSTAYATAR